MKKSRLYTAVISAMLLFALTACGNTTQQVTSDSANPGASQSEAPVDTPEVSAYAVGDTVELNDWSIELTAFEFADKIDGDFNMYVSPDEGCKFGVAHLSITNNAKEAANFLPTLSLSGDVRARVLCGEYEFSPTNLLSIGDDLHDETLNPLVTVSGIIAFNVPDSVVDGADPLILALEESGETLEFTLR